MTDSQKCSKQRTVEETYQIKTDHQHILDRPDSYIGSCNVVEEDHYVVENQKIVKKTINYNPGILKIFDEIIVNAIDKCVRDSKCDTIKVCIDQDSGIVSVWNNGEGVPIVIHKELGIYIPEMIFGNLRTSSNYDDTEKRIVGGTNGFGAKCICENTNVLLFDGGSVLAKDLKVGQRLIGDNGDQRTILSKQTGKGVLYTVSQKNGMSYSVNENHTLTLTMLNHKIPEWKNGSWVVFWWEKGDVYTKDLKVIDSKQTRETALRQIMYTIRNVPNSNIIDIPIKEYIALSDEAKNCLSSVGGLSVNWAECKTQLSPYIIGGLAYSGTLPFCNGIPKEYLVNSREKRLCLLKGFIDITEKRPIAKETSGIHLILKKTLNKQLIYDLVYLIRSLGVFCVVENLLLKIYGFGNEKTVARTISISEPFMGNFVGIEIDGNKRHLINDFTVTHNCTNIYSKNFTVETVQNGLSYKQEFSDNMFSKTAPVIKKTKTSSFTKITFKPDYARFGMLGLDSDTISFMRKRVYDATACSSKNVKVYLDDSRIHVKEFSAYTQLYFDCQTPLAYEKIESGQFIWEVAAYQNSEYAQVSFVNGTCTSQGGKHVECVLNQITKKLGDIISLKKKTIGIKPSFIKDRIFLFIRATILNPVFTSQTKEICRTSVKDFGIKIEISDKFIEKLYKSGIVEEIISFTNFKNKRELSKTPNTSRKTTIKIDKLEDANFAGTNKSKNCTLILTEGDSARTFAISGLPVIGRDTYGVFPLRGALLNVREATVSQLSSNEEVLNIKKIVGLQHDKKYTSVDSLRYGSILILVDADSDGIHIAALIINMISVWWPELLEIKGFIKSMKTPIIKVSRGVISKEFYTRSEYLEWEKEKESTLKWNTKYYKGLGTSTALEAKDLFKRLSKNTIDYTSVSPEETNKYLLLAFEKKQADNRKEWLKAFNSSMSLDQSASDVFYSDFINKSLIHFSIYDTVRSIPSICDGLKPSQRKVIFTLLKKKYQKEIKVAQLASSVAEFTMYHHGEASLQGTIINLAQDFCGSSNINLLKPNGQFGSRINSNDSASPRYIFTELAEVTKKLFNPLDDPILNYLVEEGTFIEPEYFVPVLPIVLINGTQGIGTGYSTNIPCFNPDDIVSNIKLILESKEPVEMIPWYNKFKGSIVKKDSGTFIVSGVFKKNSMTSIRIKEIPVGNWIDDHKKLYEDFVEKGTFGISGFINESSEVEPDFLLKFKSSIDLDDFIDKGESEILKALKLVKNISTRNMHLFDSKGSIKKYNTANDILKEFVKIRLAFYTKRKDFILNENKQKLLVLENKSRFLQEIMDSDLIVYKKSKKDTVSELCKRDYLKVQDTYNYLLDLPIYSFTIEKLEEYSKKIKEILVEMKGSKTEKEMFILDTSFLV